MTIDVLLVDDHPLVRAGLAGLLSATDDVRVVGEADDGAAAVTQAQALEPDVVLMDISMPGTDGIEATRLILDAGFGGAVVMLTSFSDRTRVTEALAASSVVLALSTWRDVLPTIVIEALAAGRPVLGSRLGGIPYLIGDAGWLVEPALDPLIQALPQARAQAPRLTALARQRYLTTFHPDVLTTRLVDIYRSTSLR